MKRVWGLPSRTGIKKILSGGTIEFQIFGAQDCAVKQLGGIEDAPFEHDVDSVDYAVYFRPALTWVQAQSAHVSVFYTGKEETPNRHVFGKRVAPETEGTHLIVREGELEYVLFDTHQIKVSWAPDRSEPPSLVEAMYVTICNNLTETNSKNTLRLQPRVDMKQAYFATIFEGRVFSLDWFPPDVDPALFGLKIDPRKIPQQTALWFKLRGCVSGSKAYTLIGFFVPGRHTKDGANYSYYAPLGGGAVSKFSRAAMRLGSTSEDGGTILYLCAYPESTFYEMGWCPAPPR
jgi:hypothetical protein